MNTLQSNTMFAVAAAIIGLTTACVGDRNSLRPSRNAQKPPTISDIGDQETYEEVSKTIAFKVGDPDTPLNQLRLAAFTSNPVLVPSSNIVFAGKGARRSAAIFPGTNQFGRSIITLEVSDGAFRTKEAFGLTVHPVHGGSIILPQTFRPTHGTESTEVVRKEEWAFVTIEGEVRQPGSYRFREGLALSQLIAQAGGLTDFAGYAILYRGSTEQKIRKPLLRQLRSEKVPLRISEDVSLQAGDRIVLHFIH